jgi:hypothetical protein
MELYILVLIQTFHHDLQVTNGGRMSRVVTKLANNLLPLMSAVLSEAEGVLTGLSYRGEYYFGLCALTALTDMLNIFDRIQIRQKRSPPSVSRLTHPRCGRGMLIHS